MLNTQSITFAIVAIIIIIMFFNFLKTFFTIQNIQTNLSEGFYGPDSQGDLVLRNLYRRIHNLEAVSRIEIDQNNDFAGGQHNTPKERLIMEHLAIEISKLKSQARHEIAKRRRPVRRRNKPALGYGFDDCYYGDCQLKMDHNERILGIPSAPGSTHMYHHKRKYDTFRIPAEQQEAEDMMMV